MAADHKVKTITKTDPEVSEMLTELGRARAHIAEKDARIDELEAALKAARNLAASLYPGSVDDFQVQYEAHLARQKGAE